MTPKKKKKIILSNQFETHAIARRVKAVCESWHLTKTLIFLKIPIFSKTMKYFLI